MAGSQAAAQNAMKKSEPGDEAFSQDPDKVFNDYPGMLYHSNLLVVANKYTNKQIAERDTKIRQQNGSQEVVDTNLIVHRIKSACKRIAKQKGISWGAFRREFALQRSQSEIGQIPFSLRSFKAVQIPSDPKSFEDLNKCREELKQQGYPLEFDVKIYLVCQKYMKDNNKSFGEAVDEVCRVYGFKNRNSAVHFLKDAESRALDRVGNIVDWKVDDSLVEEDKKSKSSEFYAKREVRARDANAKASPGPTLAAAVPSGARAQAPRALNSSHEAVQTSVQVPKAQSRPNVFDFAGSAGVFGRPAPSTRLASHVNPQPLPTFLQQNAPFGGQPTFPQPGNQTNISGAPQTNRLSYTFPAPMLEARPHYQSQPQYTPSLQEQRAQFQGYVPMGGFYNGTLPTALLPSAITTADYPAAQPAFTFRRHGTNPISATSACIPNVPTSSGAIVPPSVLHDVSSEDVQLRDVTATHVGRKLPGKTVYGKRIISADPLGCRLMAFFKVLDDPDHIHHEEFDLNTFAHMITVGEADDLQETVKDITDFHKHLETKTGDLRSRYTDEQIRKVTANAVHHFMDSEYEKGAYFIKYFLDVLAKFDELVESEAQNEDENVEEREVRGDLADSEKVTDSMDIDEAGGVAADRDGSGGAGPMMIE